MTGYELRRHRVKVEGQSLSEFADFLDVALETLSRWENNRRAIPKRIADLIPLLEPPTTLPKTAKAIRRYWRKRTLTPSRAIPPRVKYLGPRIYYRMPLSELSTVCHCAKCLLKHTAS